MSEALEKTESLPPQAFSASVFEQQLGGREVLFEILSQAEPDDHLNILLGLLGDPRNRSLGLARLCRQANFHVGEVFARFERTLQMRARVLARLPIAEKLPEVAKDAMRRALTHKALCPECGGKRKYFRKDKEGYITQIDCPVCEEGWVNQEPSLDQQKLALELGELLQKTGLTIQNQQIQDNSKTVNLSMGGTLARLQQTAAEVAFAPEATEPQEGEIVDEPARPVG